MKRVLISAIAAGALLGQLHAVEVYKDGDKSFGVFGVANAVVGYGYNFSKSTRTGAKADELSEFIYGIQGNSRIGINFTVGKVFGAALIGAGESTFYKDGSDITTKSGNDWSPKAGFRQLYAGYDFGDAGKLLAGKNELVTSMGGFSSSIWDIESGLNGFGGTSTSTRRFQIAYSVAGLTVAVSENDFNNIAGLGNKSIPRISVGYEYNQDGLRAKVAASYANASRKNTNGAKDAAIVVAGAKYDLGGSYVSGMINYGFNSQLLGESKIAETTLSRGFGNVGVSGGNPLNGSARNTNLVGVMLEYGVNLTDDLGFKVGAGYQYATNARSSDKNTGFLHSYAGFVQLPYKVGGGFSIIPQVGYMGTTLGSGEADNKKIYENTGNVLAEVLFKIAF